MVVDPHDADEGEADDKRDVSRPLAQEQRRKGYFTNIAFVRNLQFQHQQGDGDGKNAVRKSFDARRLFIHASVSTKMSPENSAKIKSYQPCRDYVPTFPPLIWIFHLRAGRKLLIIRA